MPTHLWPSSSLLTVVDSGLRTHLVCLFHYPWTLYHADCTLVLSVFDCPSASPFANWPLSGFFPTPPSPTSDLVGDLESKPFAWFRAKTDKAIVRLADLTMLSTHLLIRLCFFSYYILLYNIGISIAHPCRFELIHYSQNLWLDYHLFFFWFVFLLFYFGFWISFFVCIV